jgi:hypothetical protein
LFKANMAAKGLWNIGGVNLPDFGISEFLGIGPRNAAVNPSFNSLSYQNNYGPQPVGGSQLIGPAVPSVGTSNKTVVSSVPNTYVQNPSSPSPSQPSGNGFDMKYYQGWNEDQARKDWIETGGVKGNQGGSGPSPEQYALEQSKNAINSAYDPIMSQLDQMAGMVPGWIEQRTQQLNDLYSAQQGELNASQQGAMDQFTGYRQQVAQRQAGGVRDLQENMRRMLQAGNIQLGTAGAGDSSAAGMYNFALSKTAAKGSADISNQAQQMYTELDMKQADVKSTYDQQAGQLNTWKATEATKITDWAQSLLQNIQSQKVNAVGQRAAALAAQETSIINQALAGLQNLEQQSTQWGAQMQQWAIQRLASLDDAKLKISNSAQYSPQNIVAQELQGLSSMGGNQYADYANANPYLMQYNKKKQDFVNGSY